MAGGGIGEAALIGAAFGGGKALVTGEDPLKAALLGGVTGGAMSGLTSALMPAVAGTASTAGTTAVDQAAKEALTNTAEQQIASNAATLSENAAQGAGNIGGLGGMNAQGINAFNPATNIAPNLAATNMPAQGIAGVPGSMTPYQAAPIGMNQGITQVAPASSANIGVPTQYGVQTTPGTVADYSPVTNTPVTQPAPFVRLKEMINPEAGGTLEKGLDFAIANPNMTAAGAGAAYGMLNPKKQETPQKKEEKSPLAGYNRDEFTPYDAPQPDPYPQARYTDYYNYAKEGGVMQSYAQGGITDLAAGGEMAGQGYPQGLIQGNQYANPTQAPMGQEVVSSGYEPAINTYTGSRVGPGMAEGGIASFAYGGVPDSQTGGQVYYDNQTGQYYTQSGNPMMSGMRGVNSGRNYIDGNGEGSFFGGNGKSGNMNVNPSVGEYNVAPIQNHYQAQYQQQAPVAQYNGPQGGYAPTYSLGDSMGILSNTSPATAAAVMGMGVGKAEGGIAGYSLGGYAAGGNPRLLKGPGDGMSDNIPATIGNKQPARLADGEFVVPADVVSHLGNGSTDAGAKHLYNMMDKVRKARTGRQAQGKQINPAKFMPA